MNMSEMKNVIASVFRKVGKPSMDEGEFVLALSFGFGWCSPEAARRFIHSAVSIGLMTREDDVLAPAFDVHAHELPAMYSPSAEVFSSPPKRDVLGEVLRRLSERMERDAVLEEIEHTHGQLKGMVHRQVVALLVAKKHGVDVDDLIDECMHMLLKQPSE